MPSPQERRVEIEKYERVYHRPDYRMKGPRYDCSRKLLASVPVRGSYLDVGCGRGEMLTEARALGYERVQGVEAVSYLCGDGVLQANAWDLPFDDNSFDVVTLFDVLEHILPGDDERVVRELLRVARHAVLITAANYPSRSTGVELHVNRRAYDEWDKLLTDWGDPHVVTWLPRQEGNRSETWQIEIHG